MKLRSKRLTYGLHTTILLGLGMAAHQYLNGKEVFNALRSFEYSYLPMMLGLAALYMASHAWRFVILTRPVAPDVPTGVIFRAFWAGQAATLLPGGYAVRAGLMNQAGVTLPKGAAAVAYATVLDYFFFVTASLLVALRFESVRLPVLILIACILGIWLLLRIPRVHSWTSKWVKRTARRFDLYDSWFEFLESARTIWYVKRIWLVLVMTFVNFALMVPILDLSLRGVGVTVSYPILFLAYIVPMLTSILIPLPGGIGVIEVGMVGLLVSTTGISGSVALAAVAIFRVSTTFWQAVMGTLVYIFAWRGEEEQRLIPQPVSARARPVAWRKPTQWTKGIGD